MGRFVIGRRAQRLDGRRCGQDGQRVGVEHMLAMPLQHRHEHRVAAFGAFHQHRRHDGHHHPEEALPAHTFADIRQGDRRIRPECPVVVVQQRVVVFAPILHRQCTTEEIRQIGHRRSPGDRLPINDGQRACGTVRAEQQVVQPIVTMHKTMDPVRRLPPRPGSRRIRRPAVRTPCGAAARSGRRSDRRSRRAARRSTPG